MRTTPRRLLLALSLVLGMCLAAPPATARPARTLSAPSGTGMLQAAFAAAAAEFGVPERLLLAVSYNLSRWESHTGAPSVAGGYGPMHLVDSARSFDAKGEGDPTPQSLPRAL